MADIQWQEPPSSTRGPASSRYTAIAAALKSNPGKWALVGDYAGSASKVSVERSLERHGGSFEVTCRGRDDGRWDLYARAVAA